MSAGSRMDRIMASESIVAVDGVKEAGADVQANTMLLYPLDEAVDLLSQKLEAANKTHDEVVEDLEWLKEQVTVMEVNFARVHNVSLV